LETMSGTATAARVMGAQDEGMLEPDEVAAMVRLHEMGWGAKRLAREFGCARNTVRRYLRAGGRLIVSPNVARRWTGWRNGFASGFSGITGMPTSSGKSLEASMAWLSVSAMSSGGSRAGGES